MTLDAPPTILTDRKDAIAMYNEVPLNDLFTRDDIIGGELTEYSRHNGRTFCYRSPIGNIHSRGSFIIFQLPRSAWFTPTREWQNIGKSRICAIRNEGIATGIGNDRLRIRVSSMKILTIYPVDDSAKLSPQKIIGLKSAWRRLLDSYPGLGFSMISAEIVCRDRGFRQMIPKLWTLSPEPTIEEFLLTFRTDTCREEFLAAYIEQVTSDRGVLSKVY